MPDVDRSKTFQWRAFTTFYVVLSFLVISTSGLILYITPPGRVANWSEWRLLGLSKEMWQAIHTVFAFLFVLAAILHLYFNWKVLVSYLRTKLHQGMKRGRELFASATAVSIVLALTLFDMPPVSNIMEFGDSISNSWIAPSDEPPLPHAALLSLDQFMKKAGIDLPKGLTHLAAQGIVPDSSSMSVANLAAKYSLTPRELFTKIRGAGLPQDRSVSEGGGYGRKTVAQICQQYGVSVSIALNRLRERSIVASEYDGLRN